MRSSNNELKFISSVVFKTDRNDESSVDGFGANKYEKKTK